MSAQSREREAFEILVDEFAVAIHNDVACYGNDVNHRRRRLEARAALLAARASDAALVRQMRDALQLVAGHHGSADEWHVLKQCSAAITAANARLQEKP